MRRGKRSRCGQFAQGDDAIGLVLVLSHRAEQRTKILDALRSRHECRFFDEAESLVTAARHTGRTVDAIIVEMRDKHGRSSYEVVRALASAGFVAPVVAYCRAGSEHSAEIRALVLAGAHELIFEGIDDTCVALRAAMGAAQQVRLGEKAASMILPLVDPKLWPFVKHVTAMPTTHRVADVADALGYHRKSLVNHCAQAKLPRPQELLAWCRLCVAAELLATTPRTVESIAFQLEFPSDTALRNMIKRYTGLRASEVRTAGGVGCVIAALTGAIAIHRRGLKATG